MLINNNSGSKLEQTLVYILFCIGIELLVPIFNLVRTNVPFIADKQPGSKYTFSFSTYSLIFELKGTSTL